MKITLKWLREYLEFDCSIKELSERLTDIGLEVEKIQNPFSFLKNFKVCEIKKIEKHPNAEKLKICFVDNGNEVLQIVCGATNVIENLKTVIAPVGAILPSKIGCKGIKISESMIRDIKSYGMLCSAEELGLESDSNGIIEIDSKYKVGKNFSECVDEELVTIEIAITPNRGDCAGVLGIARDLQASGLGKLKKKVITNIKEEINTPIKLKNTLKESYCPQFTLRLIKDVKNNNSSHQLVKRFNSSGIKVISSLVDITNFLTFDRCRPLHVFDYDKIIGTIVIRLSLEGEKFKGLDAIEYELSENMIVICDDEGVISLAGIMGGERTACDSNTKNVLVESAFFSPEKIAWAGRRLSIESDARYRFERGIDPKSTLEGINIATDLIVQSCGGKVGSLIEDGSHKEIQEEILITETDISKLLGYNFEKKFIEEKLKLLGCEYSSNKSSFRILPPSWRNDLKIKEDIIEEIARLYGYENIPSIPITNLNNLNRKVTNLDQKLKRNIGRHLVGKGMIELKTWSFVDKKHENLINPIENLIQIDNPISAELTCLRSNLLINLLNALKKNINRGYNNLAFFEIGPIFTGVQPGNQIEYIAGVRCGEAISKDWLQKNRNVDLFDVKSDFLNIMTVLDFSEDSLIIDNKQIPEYFHPRKSGRVRIGNKTVGFFGIINPKVIKKFDLKSEVGFFELDFDSAKRFCKKRKSSRSIFAPSQFQSSKRDFSFVLEKEILSSKIINTIKKVDRSLIKTVRVFDLFEGTEIGHNNKALAVEVTIQSDQKTLTDDELERLSSSIIKNVQESCNAKLRP